MEAMHEKAGGNDASLDLGTVVRGLAHDIANPLNAIAMNAELAKVLFDRQDTARLRDVLDRLVADCMRFGRLVQSIQRFGAGLHAGERQTFGVRDMLESAAGATRCESPGTQTTFHIHGNDARLRGDQHAMERAISNVLQNSVDAGASVVNIRCEESANTFRMEFEDDGKGIKPEHVDRVGEPFFTTRRSLGGSGLGIALAREVIRLHGGSLRVTSNGVNQTRVAVELPAINKD